MLRKIELVVGFIVVFTVVLAVVIATIGGMASLFVELGFLKAVGAVSLFAVGMWCLTHYVDIVFDWMHRNRL